MTNQITLQPGDAVLLPLDDETYHAVGEAFLAAGAETLQGDSYPAHRADKRRRKHYALAWDCQDNRLYHPIYSSSDSIRRILIPSQVINATNARKQTPAEAAGFRVGDRGIVNESRCAFMAGSQVKMAYDDGTDAPFWETPDRETRGYLRLSAVDPIPQGHTSADILREIADEAATNAEFWREFEYRGRGGWTVPRGKYDLFGSVFRDDWEVRRKPRTVRIEGELSREQVETLRGMEVSLSLNEAQEYALNAVLSLVDE